MPALIGFVGRSRVGVSLVFLHITEEMLLDALGNAGDHTVISMLHQLITVGETKQPLAIFILGFHHDNIGGLLNIAGFFAGDSSASY